MALSDADLRAERKELWRRTGRGSIDDREAEALLRSRLAATRGASQRRER